MSIPEGRVMIFFGVASVLILAMILRDGLRKRRIKSMLARRAACGDEEFARAFFPEPKRGALAVRVRRVLASNLKLPLDGLLPSDRLDDDLNAELAANPDLFWELEAEFGITTGADEVETFESVLASLITFQDLVEFVEKKLAKPEPPKPESDDEQETSRAYNIAIKTIPVLCIGGFVMAVVGILIQGDVVTGFGGAIFVIGIAIWGLANGGELLNRIVHSARISSWANIVAHPWALIFWTCFALFLLWIGGAFLWQLLRSLLSAN